MTTKATTAATRFAHFAGKSLALPAEFKSKKSQFTPKAFVTAVTKLPESKARKSLITALITAGMIDGKVIVNEDRKLVDRTERSANAIRVTVTLAIGNDAEAVSRKRITFLTSFEGKIGNLDVEELYTKKSKAPEVALMKDLLAGVALIDEADKVVLEAFNTRAKKFNKTNSKNLFNKDEGVRVAIENVTFKGIETNLI